MEAEVDAEMEAEVPAEIEAEWQAEVQEEAKAHLPFSTTKSVHCVWFEQIATIKNRYL